MTDNNKLHMLKIEISFRLKIVIEKFKYFILNDKKLLQIKYYKRFNKSLNLENPLTFNEKIQWLKLYDRNPNYSKLVDKYEVREYVRNKIGEKYLNKLYGVYNKTEEINLDTLPEKFVMKTTHDSGGVIICKNKKDIDWKFQLGLLKLRMKQNYYYLSREYHYKEVKPRIICEELLEDPLNQSLIDYKLFCFNGKVNFIQVDVDRFEGHTRNFYNTNWELLEFTIMYDNAEREIERPENLDELIQCSEKLSEGITFCRVDLYTIKQKIYFGEITFFPEAGFGKISPEKYELKLGELIRITSNSNVSS